MIGTILILGHQGMLGRELVQCFEATGLNVVGSGRPEVDITEASSIERLLKQIEPAVLLNAAAYTAVDQAESDAETAFMVNGQAAAHLATACQAADIPLIHFSTDYVFDGLSARPYCEDDMAKPIGIYGKSKWQEEVAIRQRHPKHIIIRTAWLYGHYGPNFVTTILRLARERNELRVVDDQRGSPTWTRDLANALAILCQRLLQQHRTQPWGTYHLCSHGQTTWHQFAQAILEAARPYEQFAAQHVLPIPTAEYPIPAKRPANSVLNCGKIQSVLGIALRPWQACLHDYINTLYA